MEGGAQQVGGDDILGSHNFFVKCRSGKLDRIMAALDFNWIERKVIRFHKSITELDLSSACSPPPTTPLASAPPNAIMNITSYLPLNSHKSGMIPLDGRHFMLEVINALSMDPVVKLSYLVKLRVANKIHNHSVCLRSL